MEEIKFNTRTDYLTEQSLGEFLSTLFKGEEIIHDKKIKELGFRPDYYLPNKKLVVEFDGYRHYTDNKIVIADIEKECIMVEKDTSFIRIPYFVQLSKRNIEILFHEFLNNGKEIVNDFNSYEDGFIDSKAALPGQFSSLGLKIYRDFYCWLVQDCGEKGMDLVLDIQSSLLNKFILEDHSFFECFPETDYRNVKFNYQLVKDYYEMYEYEEEGVKSNLIDLQWLKDYIEITLNQDIDLIPDSNVQEDFTDKENNLDNSIPVSVLLN